MKVCSKCRIDKPLEEFWADKRRKGKLQAWCKSCRRIAQNEYRKRNPGYEQLRYQREKDKHREKHLKRKYGFSLALYAKVLSEQRNRCAICGCEESKSKMFAVDHNHTSGKVRGLLCSNCNRMLGYAKENIETLSKAIEYLTKSHTSACAEVVGEMILERENNDCCEEL